MTSEEFFASIERTYGDGIRLIRSKNADYGGKDVVFKNFMASAHIGVSPERAILVRVMDKMSRVSQLLDKPAEVTGEKIDDTLIDAINYLAILKAMLESKRPGSAPHLLPGANDARPHDFRFAGQPHGNSCCS